VVLRVPAIVVIAIAESVPSLMPSRGVKALAPAQPDVLTAYSGDLDRLFRANVTGHSAGSTL